MKPICLARPIKFYLFIKTFSSPSACLDGGVLDQAEETEDSQEGEVQISKSTSSVVFKPAGNDWEHLYSMLQRSEVAPMEESNAQTSPPPPPPPIRIKDEPIDEGYDAALLPQSSIRQIKEELEQQEVCVCAERNQHPPSLHVLLIIVILVPFQEELRISSVYSVGGANTFAPPASKLSFTCI